MTSPCSKWLLWSWCLWLRWSSSSEANRSLPSCQSGPCSVLSSSSCSSVSFHCCSLQPTPGTVTIEWTQWAYSSACWRCSPAHSASSFNFIQSAGRMLFTLVVERTWYLRRSEPSGILRTLRGWNSPWSMKPLKTMKVLTVRYKWTLESEESWRRRPLCRLMLWWKQVLRALASVWMYLLQTLINKSWTSSRSWLASPSTGTKGASSTSRMKLSQMLRRAKSTTTIQMVLKVAILTSSVSGGISSMRMMLKRQARIMRCRMCSRIAQVNPNTPTRHSAISLKLRPRSCLGVTIMMLR